MRTQRCVNRLNRICSLPASNIKKIEECHATLCSLSCNCESNWNRFYVCFMAEIRFLPEQGYSLFTVLMTNWIHIHEVVGINDFIHHHNLKGCKVTFCTDQNIFLYYSLAKKIRFLSNFVIERICVCMISNSLKRKQISPQYISLHNTVLLLKRKAAVFSVWVSTTCDFVKKQENVQYFRLIKALTALVDRLSLRVGWKNGPERGFKNISFNPTLHVI